MRQLKLRQDAPPTKLTEPGFTQSFEPGETHEVPDEVFDDYVEGTHFEPGYDEVADDGVTPEEFLEGRTVDDLEGYLEDVDPESQDVDATLAWLEELKRAEDRETAKEALQDKIGEIRENLKSAEDEDSNEA